MSRNTLSLRSGAFPAPLNFPAQATRPPMQLSGAGPGSPGVAPQLPRHVQQHQGEFQTQMQPGGIPPGRPGNTAGPSTPSPRPTDPSEMAGPAQTLMVPLSHTLQFQIPAYGGALSTPISQAEQEWVDGLFEPEPRATPVNVVHPVVPHYPLPVMPSVLGPPAYSPEALAHATPVDAVRMVSGASPEWPNEGAFWSDVLDDVGSPERGVLRQAMAALAQRELRGRPNVGAIAAWFNAARVGVGTSAPQRPVPQSPGFWLDGFLGD